MLGPKNCCFHHPSGMPIKNLRMFRLTRTRLVTYFLCFLVCLFIIWNSRLFSKEMKMCDMSKDSLNQLVTTMTTVHRLLLAMKLTHTVCYGSLVGQIYFGKPLPWEEVGSFCVVNEEFGKYDEKYLADTFTRAGLEISYSSGEGKYIVKPDNSIKLSQVELVVFGRDKDLQDRSEDTLHRVGWKRRLLPPHCLNSPSLQCIPARLLEGPLDTRKFGSGDLKLPVPRETIEILKYFYPESWWKAPARPDFCLENQLEQ